MSSLSRSVVLALILLLAFLGVALGVQWWVLKETQRLQNETVAIRSRQLDEALALAPRPPAGWDGDHRQRLGRLIGGTVTLVRHEAAAAQSQRTAGTLRLDRPLPGHPDWTVHAELQLATLERLHLLHQRSLVAIVLLGAVIVLVPVWLGIAGARQGETAAGGSRFPWRAMRSEAAGLEHFARMTVERGDALEREHGARVRAEENFQVSQTQLDRSLAERVRLGQELHDNVSQTLYAATLTLESVRRKMTAAPEVEQRLEQCMAELKRLNREVRAHLRELEPGQVKREPLSAALTALAAGFASGGTARIESRLDEEALALIPQAHTADIVNIVREAISNSLRHGGARQITLRAERSDASVALAVVDDGTGFDPENGKAGHGLANMQARAAGFGGSVRVTTEPGKGTRVLLTLPVASEATT